MPQVCPSGSNGKALHVPLPAKSEAQNGTSREAAPTLSDAEKAALYWIGTFHHLHSEATPYIPILFKLVRCPLRSDDGQAVLGDDGQPVMARYVWEVAVQRIGRRSKWTFILWGIDDYSLRIRECRTLHEAKALYEQPARAILTLKAPGVRLRKDRLPDLSAH